MKSDPGQSSALPRRSAVALAVTLSLATAACASHTLSAGASLATAGQTAAMQMEQNIAISGDRLQEVQIALTFTDGYNGVPNASKALQDQILILQSNLAAYTKLLDSLGSSYASLGALSGYAGAANFNTAAKGLSTNVDAFAKAVGVASPISAAATSGIGAIGGQIISAVQADQVKAASDIIKQNLDEVIRILNTDGMRAKVVPAQGLIEGDIDTAALVLYASGAFSSAPLIDQIGTPMGLKSVSDVDAVAAKNPKIQAGLRNVERKLAAGHVAAIGASYDQSFKLLQALAAMHKSIDQGERIDTATISAITAQLQTIATSLQAPKASASTPSGK